MKEKNEYEDGLSQLAKELETEEGRNRLADDAYREHLRQERQGHSNVTPSRVIKVEAKDGYVLALEFQDGTKGMVSLADRLYGSVFEPLKDPEIFAQVRIDEFGVVCWPNGADLDSIALYREIRG